MRLSMPVFPTPLYEVTMMVGVFGILWALRKRLKVPGMLFFVYLMLIAVERFFIEKIRVNVPHDFLGMKMSQAQIISLGLLAVGVVGIVVQWLRHRSAK